MRRQRYGRVSGNKDVAAGCLSISFTFFFMVVLNLLWVGAFIAFVVWVLRALEVIS